MSLTKPLNSKVNMKQYSDADLPVNPKQPAIARYAAESTANQTTINLPFQIDTVNAADSFLLMVDGKVLTPGSTNDYQFAGVDSFGFSSTISLNYSLSAGLNIQAIKLGLKKETEFAQDARFTSVYESQDQGFQAFVRTSDLMVATTSAGTPVNGQFYSSIQNRASLPDMRTDLKVRMGIDRIHTQAIFAISTEFGPNGEPVWGAQGDTQNIVRFVGSGWTSLNDDAGARAFTAQANDYVEVTFYGTGINLIGSDEAGVKDNRPSLDGGTEGANIRTATQGIFQNRNTAPNVVYAVYSGLALGVHTLRLRVASNNMSIFGFEIINDSLLVNQGASYSAGKKATLLSQQSLVYNSSFESGTLGTRGGRVLVYQKADGSIAKAVQPVNASQANLTSADHSNEEVARIFNIREFGAALGTDFSTLSSTASNRYHTLDDGCTSLNASNQNILSFGLGEGIAATGSGDYIQFTFVGTGLDIVNARSVANTMPYTVNVDGTAIITANAFAGSGLNNVVKIVSGLPYGSHTVRITSTGGGNTLLLSKFIVYQPKKPTLPAGAIELADYNILANFSFVATASSQGMSTGVLSKSPIREVAASGSGFSIGQNLNAIHGSYIQSPTNADFIEYSFYGTGITYRFFHPATTGTVTIAIDGNTNLSGFTTQTQFGATTAVFTPAAGTLATSGGTIGDSLHVSITGLTLGKHTIRITKTAGTGPSPSLHGFDIVTPIHSYKSKLYSQQNSLPTGSQGISDNRKTSPLKLSSAQSKNLVQAFGIASGPTVSSTTLVPMPDMSAVITTESGRIEVDFSTVCSLPGTSQSGYFALFVNGVQEGIEYLHSATQGGNSWIVSFSRKLQLAPGTHKIDVYWRGDGATVTAIATRRLLSVLEN